MEERVMIITKAIVIKVIIYITEQNGCDVGGGDFSYLSLKRRGGEAVEV